MNIDIIRELMDKFNNSNIQKMDVEFDDIKIKLEKESTNSIVQQGEKVVFKEKEVVPVKEEKQEVIQGEPIKAPLVGVFYSKSSPEAKPFVEVGSHVEIGDTLCIIEAMKVMNEIKAPISGTIIDISVKDEELVEYDQIIMRIQG